MRIIRRLLLATILSPVLHAADTPNILFFLVDDMGVTDTSVPFLLDEAGSPVAAPLNKRYRTPHMARLAAQGRRFVNAHAYSVCTPTRAALITGQDASRLHITTWTHPQRTIDTGAIEDDLITPPDFMPTLARIGGANIPPGTVIDGHDISAYLQGIPGTHRPQQFVLHFPNGRHNNVLFTTWIDGDWKLIYQYEPKDWQLFNLTYDVGEQEDLLAEHPKLAMAMAKRMIARLDQQKAQYPVDQKSGKPIKPDLSPIQKALRNKTAAATPEPELFR